MEKSYNARCPAVKRLLKEAQELHEATEEYCAYPLEDNLFEWHFTVRGPPDTEFDGGIFHGRIMMPTEYPMKPPNIIFFTPNGRFETNKKICLSISGHHPEMWQPSWSIRTALLAIIGFMPTPANDFECPECGRVADLVKERTGANEELQKEAKAVSSQMVVTGKENIPGSFMLL
ncbi:Ubiquitin-conjugating enzyme E2 J1, partial [Armadillidium vulgare]